MIVSRVRPQAAAWENHWDSAVSKLKRSLPIIARWPNLEVVIITFFAPGLVKSSSSIIRAHVRCVSPHISTHLHISPQICPDLPMPHLQ